MECSNRPLTKRRRAALACNGCRLTKSKCDSNRPVCGRCARQQIECLYSQNNQDKRLEIQKERKARWALKNSTTNSVRGPSLTTISSAGEALDTNTSFISSDGPETRSSPAQITAGEISDVETPATNPASAVDILATGAFDHRPAAEIGYFGPTSNHALFRSLTTAIANCGQRGTISQQPSSERQHITAGEEPQSGRMVLPRPASSADRPGPTTKDNIFPSPLTSIKWIKQFFDTVGQVLPYVNESTLLREAGTLSSRQDTNRRPSRSIEALLSIVFAHSLSTTDANAAEPFYHHALGLLLAGEQTVCISNLETVQALLLLGSFQQNSHRAMASLTSHSLVVKTAYQLGLHSPSSYEGLGTLEKELRAKAWFAVVNQDRLLSHGLGRPLLIPINHVRAEILESLITMTNPKPVTVQPCMESLVYFRHLTCLHEIVGVAIDSIYTANIGSPSDLTSRELTGKTIELLLRLEDWRRSIGPFDILKSSSDLGVWTPSKLHSERYVVMLTLFYHKIVMIVSWPVLMTVLDRATDRRAGDVTAPGVLQDTFVSVIKQDLHAIQEFQRIMEGIFRCDRSFFKCNAVWWVCNFTALTQSLHMFSVWLISIVSPALQLAMSITSADAESLLLKALHILKTIGGASIMSSKAYRCLNQYIQLCRTFASEPWRQDSIPGADLFQGLQSCPLPSDTLLWDGFPGYSMNSLDNLFCQLGDNDFLNAGGFSTGPEIGQMNQSHFAFDASV